MIFIDSMFQQSDDEVPFLAGRKLHPSLGFIPGSPPRADLWMDHARMAAYLHSLGGVATMDYEPEQFTAPTPGERLRDWQNAIRSGVAMYRAAGVPCCNYDVWQLARTGGDYATTQVYRSPGEKLLAWIDRIRGDVKNAGGQILRHKLSTIRKQTQPGTLLVWLNTHDIYADPQKHYNSSPIPLRDMRCQLRVLQDEGVDGVICWRYGYTPITEDLPAVVAARELI